MLNDLLQAELIACPVCRGMVDGQFIDHPLYMAQTLEQADGVVVQGFLGCRGCTVRHPIVDGVAIVFKNTAEWLRQQERPVLGRGDLDAAMSNWLANAWADDQDPNWRRQMLGIYAQDLAGESDRPHEFSKALEATRQQTRAFIEQRQAAVVASLGDDPLVLDAGCAVGASSLGLQRAGARVIALDHDFGPLRMLATLLREGSIEVPHWRAGGNDYSSTTVQLPAETDRSKIAVIASDATDPPFRPGIADAVTAYNVIDNVAEPVLLLRQLHAILKTGGTLISSSPYDWVSRCTEPEHRLGESIRADPKDGDAGRALIALLTGLLPSHAPEMSMTVQHEHPGLPWVLHRHDRSAHLFMSHYVEASKG